jgi:SAM-dependent methyltransferase
MLCHFSCAADEGLTFPPWVDIIDEPSNASAECRINLGEAMTDVQKERVGNVWGTVDYGPIAVGDVLVSELLARAVDVHSGDQVLDIGTGTGNTALAAARRGGVVVATDVVPGVLDTARRRAMAEGLELAYGTADAVDLPFEDDSFDVVVSTFGVMYAGDHQQAANELLRVCRPGGRIGLTNWTPTGLTARLQKTLATLMPPPGGGRGKPPVMWGDEQYCRQLFGDRVREFRFETRTDEWCAPSAAAQVERLERHLPPWHAATQRMPEAMRQKVADAAREQIEGANRATDGSLVAGAEYLEVVAVVG